MGGAARALAVNGPGAGTKVDTSATSTSAQDVGANTQRIAISCTTKTCIRFGEAGVGEAVVTDYPLKADTDYVFDVTPGTRYFRAIKYTAEDDGDLVWAVVA
jgi:hypothetical protein